VVGGDVRTDEITTWLVRRNQDYVAKRDGKLHLSKRLVRLKDGTNVIGKKLPTVIVGCDYPDIKSHPGDALVAAVRWVHSLDRDCSRFALVLANPWEENSKSKGPNNKKKDEILTPFKTLARALNDGPTGLEVELLLLHRPGKLSPPQSLQNPTWDTNKDKLTRWKKRLEHRSKNSLPKLAAHLKDAVDHNSFRWYLASNGKEWSGRVEGLQVCSIDTKKDSQGILAVGKSLDDKQGCKKGPSHEFCKILSGVQDARGLRGDSWVEERFTDKDVDGVAEVIRELSTSRAVGDLRKMDKEHHLEARILRHKVPLLARRQSLSAVSDNPFQFPTLWHDEDGSRPRYLDALMKSGDTPWAVEIKVNSSGSLIPYYSHGITQAVLYREFIRTALPFHRWFQDKERGLKPDECEGMVVVEEVDYDLSELRKTAHCFGIEWQEVRY